MNSRRLGTGLVITLVLLSSCSKAKEPDRLPPPSPTASSYGFDVAAQYTADVVLPDGVHTRRIVLTIGRPGSLVERLKRHPCSVSARPEDIAVPYHINITNTSSDNQSPALVAATLSVALDDRKFGNGGMYVQYAEVQACTLVFPSLGATGLPVVKDKGIWVWHIINDPTKKPDVSDRGAIFIMSSEGTPPPAESVFFQITSVERAAPIQYTVVRMTSSVPARAGGWVTTGPNAGAYYVPLGNTTPCSSFANGAPMKCGASLP